MRIPGRPYTQSTEYPSQVYYSIYMYTNFLTSFSHGVHSSVSYSCNQELILGRFSTQTFGHLEFSTGRTCIFGHLSFFSALSHSTFKPTHYKSHILLYLMFDSA